MYFVTFIVNVWNTYRKFLKKKHITSDKHEAKSIYAMIDENKDGQISLEEFTKFCIDLNISP